MTAALLAVRIQVTNFYGLAATFLPLNWHIDVVHINLPSQIAHQVRAAFWPESGEAKGYEISLFRS